MDMELTAVYVTYPPWFKLALLGTFMFPLIAFALRQRVRDPVALLMVLIAGDLLTTWIGLCRVSRGMSVSGAGHRAASAGAAEAQTPLLIALFIAALLAAVFALCSRSQRHRASVTLYLAVVVLFGVAVEVWFTWFVTRPGRVFVPRPETIAQTGAMFSLALLAAFLILTFRGFPESTRTRSLSAVFTVVAVSTGVLAIALWRFARSLAAVAMGQ